MKSSRLQKSWLVAALKLYCLPVHLASGQRYFMLTRPGHLTLLIASLFCGLHSNLGFTFSATTQGPLPPQKESYAVTHFLASSSLGRFHGTTLCLSAFWILHARKTRATWAKLPVLDLVRSSNTLASLNQNVQWPQQLGGGFRAGSPCFLFTLGSLAMNLYFHKVGLLLGRMLFGPVQYRRFLFSGANYFHNQSCSFNTRLVYKFKSPTPAKQCFSIFYSLCCLTVDLNKGSDK